MVLRPQSNQVCKPVISMDLRIFNKSYWNCYCIFNLLPHCEYINRNHIVWQVDLLTPVLSKPRLEALAIKIRLFKENQRTKGTINNNEGCRSSLRFWTRELKEKSFFNFHHQQISWLSLLIFLWLSFVLASH
jgi:hypothetical protein